MSRLSGSADRAEAPGYEPLAQSQVTSADGAGTGSTYAARSATTSRPAARSPPASRSSRRRPSRPTTTRAAGAAPGSGSCRWPARRRVHAGAVAGEPGARRSPRAPQFSTWSCRVGRFVIINQDRLEERLSSVERRQPRAARLPAHGRQPRDRPLALASYGGLPRPGAGGRRRRPQQSKGLQGCRFNPFPTIHELNSRTPHGRAMADLLARELQSGRRVAPAARPGRAVARESRLQRQRRPSIRHRRLRVARRRAAARSS